MQNTARSDVGRPVPCETFGQLLSSPIMIY